MMFTDLYFHSYIILLQHNLKLINDIHMCSISISQIDHVIALLGYGYISQLHLGYNHTPAEDIQVHILHCDVVYPIRALRCIRSTCKGFCSYTPACMYMCR